MKLLTALLLFVPALALGQEETDWNMFQVKNEITELKRRVDLAEEEIKTLKMNWNMFSAKSAESPIAGCPCPDEGGSCICPADGCNCPGCPLHVQPNEDAHYKILGWGASWCGPCRVGESASRADGTWDRILHYDWDSEKDRAVGQKLGVSTLPTILLVQDNKVLDRHTGAEGYAEQIREWIDSPASFALKTSAKPQRATKSDPEPVQISRTSPAYSYGSTGYNPVQRCTVTRLNGTRWTWPGDLGSHLRSAHGFNPAGFSHSQLVTIHDNFHNTGQSGVSSGGYSRSPVVRFSAPRQSFPARVMQSFSSFCPTCPR